MVWRNKRFFEEFKKSLTKKIKGIEEQKRNFYRGIFARCKRWWTNYMSLGAVAFLIRGFFVAAVVPNRGTISEILYLIQDF